MYSERDVRISGRVIPQSAWSPAATPRNFAVHSGSYRSLGGTPFFSTNASKGTVRDDKFGQRIDYNRPNSVWSIYYHFDDAAVLAPFYASNVPGFGGLTPSRSQQVNLSNTHIFGASAFPMSGVSNTTRFADNAGKPATAGEPVSKYGFVAGGLGNYPFCSGSIRSSICHSWSIRKCQLRDYRTRTPI